MLGVIGWPVKHSLSPVMQNAALLAMGLDYTYVPFAIEPACLERAVAGLRCLNVAGFNVTIPHKTAIMPFLDEISVEAGMIGAVNTVTREGDRLIGHNTDCSGFITSLKRDLPIDPRAKRILILGAGGAARAAVTGLCREDAASVTVVNRSLHRAAELVDFIAASYPDVNLTSAPMDELSSVSFLRDFDLIINTTSVGMEGNSSEMFDTSLCQINTMIYDMVYIPAVTPLLAAAARHGLRGVNGLGMLAAQGEESFRIWTGMHPPEGLMMDLLVSLVGRSQ